VRLGIGDTARALTEFERVGRISVPYLNLGDPAYDPVRGSTRFTELVRRSGFDPAVIAALRASARPQSARTRALRRS
jgi:hypothetical protein